MYSDNEGNDFRSSPKIKIEWELVRMNKTLQTLVERAERKGTAIKRVRANQIMGNQYGSNEMVNQWEIVIEDNRVKVYHYDTLIFHVTKEPGMGWVLQDYYGESKSDADALNGLCRYYHIDMSFSYGSRKGFVTA
jgi:hypothetical protein